MKCRFCKHYTFEGRGGGFCALMNTTMMGNMKACRYAVPPFTTGIFDIDGSSGVHTSVSFVRPVTRC